MARFTTGAVETGGRGADGKHGSGGESRPVARLDSIETDGSTLRCGFSYEGPLRRFFSGDPLVTDYGTDLSDVADAVLAIPWLANVCPVAWASGADVSVPVVDERFLDALVGVRRTYLSMYPEFMEGGRILADAVVDASPGDCSGGTGLMFSGGVDSIASYLRHREADPELLTVHGTDVFLDQRDAWQGTRQTVEAFADRHDLRTHFVRSNMRHFLDRTMLEAHYSRYVDHLWYSSVQQGLGLLGTVAPLAHARGFGRLLIASSKWRGRFCEPWGSHPDIDPRLAWADTEVVYDAEDLTRQEKLGLIARYVRREAPDLTLRTCFWDEGGGNCNRCEKCARTIVGLTVAGLDPNDHGYAVDERAFRHFREQLERGSWSLDESHAAIWADVQDHVAPDLDYPVDGAAAFFDWFAVVDLYDYVREDNSAGIAAVRAVARNTPYPVYAALYPVYKRLFG